MLDFGGVNNNHPILFSISRAHLSPHHQNKQLSILMGVILPHQPHELNTESEVGWPSIGQFLVEVHIRHGDFGWAPCTLQMFLTVEKRKGMFLFVRRGTGVMFKGLADILCILWIWFCNAKFECMIGFFCWLLHGGFCFDFDFTGK